MVGFDPTDSKYESAFFFIGISAQPELHRSCGNSHAFTGRTIYFEGAVFMTVEPQTGFEPAFHAWKARALPFELLRHVCILFQLSQSVAVCQRPGSYFRVCGVTCSVVPQVYRSESVRLPRMGATQQFVC